jgi:transcriptional regulator with XRE-family HTH domain
MGRIERAVDPSAGPLQRFAHDLQILRHQAGEPTYRTMGRRAGVSYSALSQAAKGEHLPTLAVTLAFLRACGATADIERQWQRRWEQLRADLSGTPPRVNDDDPEPADDGNAGLAQGPYPDHESRPVPARRRRRYAVIAVVALMTAVAVAASTMAVAALSTASHAAVRHVADGADPYIAGCGPDQQPLERQPIYLSSGQRYGWIVLFYSAACSGAWGYVLGPNSTSLRVYISAHRMDDNTSAVSSFKGNARPNSWGNALSTQAGCVRAEAWVNNGPRAVTSCWRPNGSVVHH